MQVQSNKVKQQTKVLSERTQPLPEWKKREEECDLTIDPSRRDVNVKSPPFLLLNQKERIYFSSVKQRRLRWLGQ
jgi:hypothetical protein